MILCRNDRGGLGTWLATRKAVSDKRLAEKEEKKENIWLAPETSTSNQTSASRATSVRQGLLRAGDIKDRVTTPISEISDAAPAVPKETVKESVKEGLMKAWGSFVEVEDKENVCKATPAEQEHNDRLATPSVHHPMIQMYRKIQDQKPMSRDIQSWVPGPQSESRPEKEKILIECPAPNKMFGNFKTSAERNSWLVRSRQVNNSALINNNCWLLYKEEENKTGFSVEENVYQKNEQLRKSLLSAWAGVEKEEEVPSLKKEEVTTKEEEVRIRLRMSLMNLWKEEEPEEDQSWDDVDDTAESEASIVTLDTLSSDPIEEYDDFSDMQIELSQWISKS